jgi:ABC-type transporter Mla MlaB component
MSKEDSSPGLFSKMAKFVRNPAASWSGLSTGNDAGEEAVSKQLLKEMIERKRRNDFVRKREFDMLRKLRKREAKDSNKINARPSFFQSSMPSKLDDRAKTLKKIDEIEAQMSMQWWKTNSQSTRNLSSSSSQFVSDTLPESAPNSLTQPGGYEATEIGEAPFSDSQQSAQPERLVKKSASTFSSTLPHASSSPAAQSASPSTRFVGSPFHESSISSFSASKVHAIDVEEAQVDACLEEIAILFASGDDDSAEIGLLEILAPTGLRSHHIESWMMLFDLYRITGEQEKFETAALEFVQRFERSAPQWFSMPALFQQQTNTDAPLPGNGPAAHWMCPSVVGIQSLVSLRAALDKHPMPWRLDWRNLKSVEVAALIPLSSIFTIWASKNVQLHFFGNNKLQNVLKFATFLDDKAVDPNWWLLRLEALRVTHQSEEFEAVALDYCVTYDVSPPAWEKALCAYKCLDLDGSTFDGSAIVSEIFSDFQASSMISVMGGDTQIENLSPQFNRLASAELSGQIKGDVIAVLDELKAKLIDSDMLLISCTKLARIDFSAASALLNWVMARASENRNVKFTDVNRLVAVFFNVIGISAHADIEIRND